MGTAKLCILSSIGIVGLTGNPKRKNSARSTGFDSAFFRPINHSTASSPLAPLHTVKVSASSSVEGARGEELEVSSTGMVGADDLLIVGPGVLGRIVAEQWRKEHPGSQIYGQTRTSDHHDELIQMGISPSLKGMQVTHKFPYVIYCAPPYQSPDYPGDVREATLNWNGEGSFVFTSSSAPYDCSDNGSCDEDAASLSIAILKKNLRGRIFLGCDNHPLSRQELMELVNKSGKFRTNDPLGKKLDNSKTRAALGWEPKYPSFVQFLESL
ncbi:hypothetical protein F511_05400 [Dorcoceras hygrometricum]|uniref:NAD(P)-binding domain-containing protein n=1 Tax=Dorcoceras hygrometricum TaxID=472368 RepID=A0A2Z7BGW1_9LAMI|nr:hypothetical protein F511_05400 [Dorcoceras hygrometricum]